MRWYLRPLAAAEVTETARTAMELALPLIRVAAGVVETTALLVALGVPALSRYDTWGKR